MYESPIEIVLTQVQQKVNDDVLQVVHKYGIDVDKGELLKALAYDRNQYDKGYNDGHREAMDSIVRCKECKHLMFSDMYGECGRGYMGIVSPNDFCSNGERKDGANK